MQKQIELKKMNSAKTTLTPVSFDAFKQHLFWSGREYLWFELKMKD